VSVQKQSNAGAGLRLTRGRFSATVSRPATVPPDPLHDARPEPRMLGIPRASTFYNSARRHR
jgi:hypothetical protein